MAAENCDRPRPGTQGIQTCVEEINHDGSHLSQDGMRWIEDPPTEEPTTATEAM